MNSLARLTDASLHSETKRLVGSSNALTAQLLAHLGEVEARGIHRERACSSLYAYCVYELRMSEDEAQRRCRAARLARQFPALLEMLAEASLHLTGILLLGPHLTAENCAELLARARFRTKREIERLVAEIAPGCDVPSRIVPLHRAGAEYWMVSPLDDDSLLDSLARPRNTWAAYVRALAGEVRQLRAGLGAGQAPPRASEEEAAAATGCLASNEAAANDDTGVRTPAIDERRNVRQDLSASVPSGESRPPASAPPVAEPRYRVQFTADQTYVELLEEARNLLQHELPSRDIVAVQRRALELLVHKLRQRKYAASERPRPTAAKPVNGGAQLPPALTPARPPAQQSATRAPPAVPRSTRTQHCAPPPPPPPDADSAPPSQADARRFAPPSQPDAQHCASQSHARNSAPPSQADVRHAASRSKTHARHSAPPSETHARHPPQAANQSRYIPAEVRRSVWKRDEARCTYVDTRGQRCREQAGLEFHHQHPHARRGPPSIANLALRCRSHNTLAAEQDFGRDFIRDQRVSRATLAEQNRAGAAP